MTLSRAGGGRGVAGLTGSGNPVLACGRSGRTHDPVHGRRKASVTLSEARMSSKVLIRPCPRGFWVGVTLSAVSFGPCRSPRSCFHLRASVSATQSSHLSLGLQPATHRPPRRPTTLSGDPVLPSAPPACPSRPGLHQDQTGARTESRTLSTRSGEAPGPQAGQAAGASKAGKRPGSSAWASPPAAARHGQARESASGSRACGGEAAAQASRQHPWQVAVCKIPLTPRERAALIATLP